MTRSLVGGYHANTCLGGVKTGHHVCLEWQILLQNIHWMYERGLCEELEAPKAERCYDGFLLYGGCHRN